MNFSSRLKPRHRGNFRGVGSGKPDSPANVRVCQIKGAVRVAADSAINCRRVYAIEIAAVSARLIPRDGEDLAREDLVRVLDLLFIGAVNSDPLEGVMIDLAGNCPE